MAGKSLIARAVDRIGSFAGLGRTLGLSRHEVNKARSGDISRSERQQLNAQLRGVIERADRITRASDRIERADRPNAPIMVAKQIASERAIAQATGLSSREVAQAKRGAATPEVNARIEKWLSGKEAQRAREFTTGHGHKTNVVDYNKMPEVAQRNREAMRDHRESIIEKLSAVYPGVGAGDFQAVFDSYMSERDAFERAIALYLDDPSKANFAAVRDHAGKLRRMEAQDYFDLLRKWELIDWGIDDYES